jgi:hypothetical protein
MRVLLACASYPPHGKGGGPQSSQCIAVGLSERGHEVRVLTVAGQEKIEQRLSHALRQWSGARSYRRHVVELEGWLPTDVIVLGPSSKRGLASTPHR